MREEVRRVARMAAALVVCLAGARARAVAPLVPIAGSPFVFEEGDNSSVVALSRDERFLFVSNQWSESITVLEVAPSGALTRVGTYTTGREPAGMAVRPSGGMLWVAAQGSLESHAVAPDGTLTRVQTLAFPGAARNGLVHLTLPGGEFVYALDNGWQNAVRVFAVQTDGTLVQAGVHSTGGNGLGGYFASPRLVASGRKLFALNADSVAVLLAADDGALSAAPGSPFPLALPSGALALDPGGERLYAGSSLAVDPEPTYAAVVVRFSIAPDGSLAEDGVFRLGTSQCADGLAVHPSGDFLVAGSPYERALATFDLDALAPVDGSPTVTDSTGSFSSLVFDRAGTRLFVGNSSFSTTNVSVYTFVPAPHLTATVEVHPETLNLGSRGKINAATVFVEGAVIPLLAAFTPDRLTLGPAGGVPVPASPHPSFGESDWNGNGVPDLVLKFDRQALEASIGKAARAGAIDLSRPVELTLMAGSVEVGSDTVRVIAR